MSLTEFDEEEFIRNRREEGFEDGAHQKAVETARKMLSAKKPIDEIILFTDLDEKQIRAIEI